jgi:tRNA threonylcarbamoyladenosine modification (KEOPS) complex  Pcc1 subunit
MRYEVSVRVIGDARKVYKYLALEGGLGDRSRTSVRKDKGDVVADVRAEDAAALRSALNALSQGLAVYEKMAVDG